MKTEATNLEAVTAENRYLPDNYRLITGYPSDNSHLKNETNPFTTNNKEQIHTETAMEKSEITTQPVTEVTEPARAQVPLVGSINIRQPQPVAESTGTNSPVPTTDPVDLVRQLIPASLRQRRFRADSFMAKLTPTQRARVISWLQQDTAEAVRAKVAAPPPVGFGLDVHTSALYRIRNLVSNTELNHWIENAMDATYDVLEADTSVDTAPMRDALSLLLHSRIMTYTREQTDPVSIDRLISALTRLEKLKTHIAQRPHLVTAKRKKSEKSIHHQVDVRITTNPGTPTPITIQATHQSLPDASAPGS